jgi:hypothetical protein
MPRFPELDSTITVSGLITPASIASLRIFNAGLSFALPPGLNPSSLAKRRNLLSLNTRFNLINGVLPIVDKIPSCITIMAPAESVLY